MLKIGKKNGLTFIELLIIIALIAVLAAMVIFFAQPGERVLKARDDHREVHLGAIFLGAEKKIDLEDGRWLDYNGCEPIPTDKMTIISSEPGHYDLYSCLLPEGYLEEPLYDPLFGHYNSLEDYNTRYKIWRNPVTGKISLRAEGETRYVYAGDPEPPMGLAIGEACVLDRDCDSGYCADDVCCEERCGAICEVCNLGDVGICDKVPAGQDPRDSCPLTAWRCENNYTKERDVLLCDGTGSGEEACTIVKETETEAGAKCSDWCYDGGEEAELLSHFLDTRDGNDYKTVLINGQCWMAQNMDIGTRIDGGSNQGVNCNAIEKYCYNNSDPNCTSNNPTYPDGGLYQWNQAMCNLPRGICPEGWRMPANEDWEQLSGFEGNMAGHRNLEGGFGGRGDYTGFWSSTQYTDDSAWYWSLYEGDANFYKLIFDKKGGFSVRCIWDGEL